MNSKKRYPTRTIWKHCAIALGLPVLFAACSKPAEEAAPSPLPVKTVQLGSDFTQSAQAFPISMVRDRESNLSFRVGGVIASLHVRAGQMVQAGQPLATLTSTPYTSNRARAATDVSKLQNAARRNEELLKAGAVSTGTKEDTEDALAAAKAVLSAAQYDEESTTIKAPFTGIVLSRDAELGETVAPGQRVVRIADSGSTVIAKASVPTQLARNLHTGGSALVRVGESTLAATIRYIGALSDPKTGSVSVDLVVQHASSIASGTLGSVEFVQKTASKSGEDILLPPEALLESTGGVGSVYVLDVSHSVARRTPIKVLGFEGEMIRIAGLDRGVRVLTTGAGFVSDGQKVLEIRQ